MRPIPLIIGAVMTALLLFGLGNRWGSIPALGHFLSPQEGFWTNAEDVDGSRDEVLQFDSLHGKVDVYLDERLVPHVFAEDDRDLYFVQGYLHAKFRLWQMEFQTFAAAGRLSEFVGDNPDILRYDREQRRLGMVYAAEQALKVMNEDTATKKFFDAYTAGVNAYIQQLKPAQLPVEYKLLGYKPEAWSNLKIALFLKAMTKDLAGTDYDLEFSNQRSVFSAAEMQLLYPEIHDSTYPIIPSSTSFLPPAINPQPPVGVDSTYFKSDTSIKAREVFKPEPDNGSNNWAVAGTRTASGAPILCNDPHLGLSLPSIWFEMQLTSPTVNTYGATFPGSPNVIIGFNEDIAFGFTNAQRDVKDYFQVRFKDESKKEYWFDSSWKPTTLRIEEIKIKGKPSFFDTVAYTNIGPVMYDSDFTSDSTAAPALALRWIAHDPSNEGAIWMKLNRARDYNDYLDAIKTYSSPAQNMLFASRSGDIALWQQGRFPARWNGQGMYIMPGEDSSYFWQGFIPQEENPSTINPFEGFIQSANQRPVDSTYPYYIPGNYIQARGVAITERLRNMNGITPQDMMQLQNDYYNPQAADLLPFLFKILDSVNLKAAHAEALQKLKGWNYVMGPESSEATIYHTWFQKIQDRIWSDEFNRISGPKQYPDPQTLIEIFLRDSSLRFVDDVTTTKQETLQDIVVAALDETVRDLGNETRPWYQYKNVQVRHLLRDNLASFGRKGLKAGGWGTSINAIKSTHGPSWRMIVHMTQEIEAYGIYPGGQSGNPGCPFYDNQLQPWVRGEYYRLWFMKREEREDKRIIGHIQFLKSSRA